MIGIDVGGANLKVVDKNGVHLHYCPLWEEAPVTDYLLRYVQGPADLAAVVMSGELADCFENKAQGISFIVGAVKAAFPRAKFYGTDARFHDGAAPFLAAANWLASADYLRIRHPGAVLLDIGSTTADIIPFGRFPELHGLTDLLRLQKGYLLYTGMLRTNIATLLRPWILRVSGHRSAQNISPRAPMPTSSSGISRQDNTPAILRITGRGSGKHRCGGLPGWSVPTSMRLVRREQLRSPGSSGMSSGTWCVAR